MIALRPYPADTITQGVPVSVLDDEYGRSTVAMAALVDKFASLDLYDPERVKVGALTRAQHVLLHQKCTSCQVGVFRSSLSSALTSKPVAAATDGVIAAAHQVIAQIKKDGSSWVSKYARGGSARKQAARKMYTVVDALEG